MINFNLEDGHNGKYSFKEEEEEKTINPLKHEPINQSHNHKLGA
jgi:hypothetical protein